MAEDFNLDGTEQAAILAGVLYKTDSPYLTIALMVDNVLKAESRQDAAYCLVELIAYLEMERSVSEQTAICLYAKTQAYSYRDDFMQAMDALTQRIEVSLNERKKGGGA